MGWNVAALAALAAVLFGLRARWGGPRVLASAALSGLAAAALRWALIETMSPAYPALAPTLAGPLVAGAVVATVVACLALDHAR